MSQRKVKKIRELEKKSEQVVGYKTESTHSIKKILRDNWIFMLFISIGIILLFLNAMRGDFVSDDYATILNNSDIHSWSYFKNNITPVIFVNFVIGNVFGVTPIPYHISSILIYILTCWMAMVFLNFITNIHVARITMLVFAVMPIHVEAVSWISGRPYLFIAFFVMFSSVAFFKYLESSKYIYVWFSLVSFLLAIMTDIPRPFSLFLTIGLYLIVVNRSDYWKKSFKLVAYVVVLIIAVFIIKFGFISGRINIVNGGYNASESIFYNPFFQYPTGIPKYLQLIFVPVDLTLYHTMYIFPVWLNWSIMLVLLGLIMYTFYRNKEVFFALVFFLVTLLPSMAPIKVSWLVAERYGYLPSLGIALLIGIILYDLWGRSKYISTIILSCWCVFGAFRIVSRNIDWQTNHNLWVNTCQVSPNSHNAWNNIGDDYDKLANEATTEEGKKIQYDNAIKGFSQSTIVKPNYADAYHNRANIFFKINRLDLARDSYETALKYSPTLYQTYLSLTQIDMTENRIDLALEHAGKASQLDPNNPQSAYVLAIVYARAGDLNKASEILTSILKSYPQYTLASEALKQVKATMIGMS